MPDPAVSGHPVHVSHRYKRKGALHLFGALSVADGKVYGKCRLRKRFVDFQAFLLGTVIPEALKHHSSSCHFRSTRPSLSSCVNYRVDSSCPRTWCEEHFTCSDA